jgi:hypothetical protein
LHKGVKACNRELRLAAELRLAGEIRLAARMYSPPKFV